jgi:hypothetical protein
MSLAWDDGNFSGDSAIDDQDFNLWNANKFTSSANTLVREPNSLLIALSIASLYRRRY